MARTKAQEFQQTMAKARARGAERTKVKIRDSNAVTQLGRYKTDYSQVAQGCPVLEFKPYRMPQQMQDALKRVEEFRAIPSLAPAIQK